MAKKVVLRGMKSVRSMRDVQVNSAGPPDEQSIHIGLHRMLTEKARLERELQMWQANIERINARLADLNSQITQARDAANEMARANEAGKSTQNPWDEMTLTYGG